MIVQKLTKGGGANPPHCSPKSTHSGTRRGWAENSTTSSGANLFGLIQQRWLTDAIELIERAGFCDRASQLLILDVLRGAE